MATPYEQGRAAMKSYLDTLPRQPLPMCPFAGSSTEAKQWRNGIEAALAPSLYSSAAKHSIRRILDKGFSD